MPGVDECQLSPDAVSAIKRATTPYCKQEIRTLACRTQKEEFFPKQLPRYKLGV